MLSCSPPSSVTFKFPFLFFLSFFFFFAGFFETNSARKYFKLPTRVQSFLITQQSVALTPLRCYQNSAAIAFTRANSRPVLGTVTSVVTPQATKIRGGVIKGVIPPSDLRGQMNSG